MSIRIRLGCRSWARWTPSSPARRSAMSRLRAESRRSPSAGPAPPTGASRGRGALAPSLLGDLRATGGLASLDFAGFGPRRIGLPLPLMNRPGTGYGERARLGNHERPEGLAEGKPWGPAHANCLSSASACSSQYVIPISRYIVVAVVRCSCACSRWPVRR
jgi:hypothetical protein